MSGVCYTVLTIQGLAIKPTRRELVLFLICQLMEIIQVKDTESSMLGWFNNLCGKLLTRSTAGKATDTALKSKKNKNQLSPRGSYYNNIVVNVTRDIWWLHAALLGPHCICRRGGEVFKKKKKKKKVGVHLWILAAERGSFQFASQPLTQLNTLSHLSALSVQR